METDGVKQWLYTSDKDPCVGADRTWEGGGRRGSYRGGPEARAATLLLPVSVPAAATPAAATPTTTSR